MSRGLYRRAWALAACLLLIAGYALAAPKYETLRPGMRGEGVVAMQNALTFVGFPLKADGSYGDLTRAAVVAFQARQGLETDGLAGNRTLSALYALAPQFAPENGGNAAAPTGEPSTSATPRPPSAGGYTMYVVTANKGSLNLRNAPRSGALTLTQIPFGDAVLVTGTQGAWSQAHYAGRSGWVVSSFLSANTPGAAPSATPAPVSTMTPSPTVTATPFSTTTPSPAATATHSPVGQTGEARVAVPNGGKLNLRSAPSYGPTTFAQIPDGAAVTVLEQIGEWSRVRWGTKGGYVVTTFLRFASTPTPSPTAAPTAAPSPPATVTPSTPPNVNVLGEAVVVTQNGRTLNFRSSAKIADNNILAQIPAGESLPLLSKGSTWCGVLYRGVSGFVMTSFLAFAEPTAAPTATPGPSATPEPEENPFPRILKSGMTGDDVKDLQQRLINLKYNCSATGTYDAMTRAAVAEFQRINALTEDGIFGTTSAQTLLSAYARPADAAPLTYKTLRIDNSDASGTTAIAELQARLKELGYPLSVNGRFDIPTHQAVVGFQWRNGLPITGVANASTQAAAFSSGAKGYSTPVTGISADEGKGGGPATSQVHLLHWFNDVKKSAFAGQQATIYHPSSNSSFTIRFYSMGHHADSEPLTWKDTQIMNRAFGSPSWNINAVYVKLPDGRWTLAAMHNRPHLTGAISGNGFGGHLCIHFLRDTAEVMANDPDYGASNQRAIRSAWKGMTGEVVE